MEDSILVKTLGDIHPIRVIGFFLEHPVHQFNVSTLSEYLNLSRDTVKKDLDIYEEMGYLVRTSERGPYKLKLSNRMVHILIRCSMEMAQVQTGTGDIMTKQVPSPYSELPCIPTRTIIAGA